MKKSKIILAIALAVAIIVTCISVPTFSWFSRPQSHNKGEKMLLNTNLNAYNGKGVTFSTMSSDTGVEGTYSTNCNGSEACSGSNIPNNNRRYFCTTITNSSGSTQNVSLYANLLSIPIADNGSLALGVNSPTRSYRNYTELTKQPYSVTRNYDMRIYFQHNDVPGWTGKNIYVSYHTPYHEQDYDGKKMEWISFDGGSTYYADIPFNCWGVFFSAEGWQTANNNTPDNTMRSVAVDNLATAAGQSQTQSKIFKIKDQKENNTNYRLFEGYYSVNGASVLEYCGSVQFKTGETYNVAQHLSTHPNATFEYKSLNESIFTVNSSGVITGVSAGTAQMRTRVKAGNNWHDYYDVYTSVTVTAQANYDFYDVPIVKNITISGSTDNDANVVKVYWYIINNSPSGTALRYSIDYLYLGT